MGWEELDDKKVGEELDVLQILFLFLTVNFSAFKKGTQLLKGVRIYVSPVFLCFSSKH